MSYTYKSKVLEKLGIRSWINANNWSTIIGGNWIPEKVLEAMNEVAKTFVDMFELIAKVDEKVAKLCKVEDAHVTTGAGAAIELSVAGCMAGKNHEKWMILPDTEGMKNEVVIPRGHYIAYTPQWRAPGSKLVEYGQAGYLQSFKKELEYKISEKTCCISHTISYNTVPRGVIPLEDVIEVGERRNVPVVVDSASMLPPVSNLHKFIDMGASIACFSGGKAIQAPNNTGIILGSGKGAKIIEGIRDNSFPHEGWGRGHKISKEQIIGLLVALEEFVENGDSLYKRNMKKAEYIRSILSEIPGVDVTIIPNDETLHEHPCMPYVPRVKVEWDEILLELSPIDVDNLMADEDPPVFLRKGIYYNYYTIRAWRLIDTFYLREGEDKIVAERLQRILSNKMK
jgi:D-glucosaminate-6-phosphate ammonia-lyase